MLPSLGYIIADATDLHAPCSHIRQGAVNIEKSEQTTRILVNVGCANRRTLVSNLAQM